jgi:hypothetical protein
VIPIEALTLMPLTPDDRKNREHQGEAHVRFRFAASGRNSPERDLDREWLAEIDEEARRRAEAHQAEQTRVGKSTLRAAWIVAGAAIVSILVTIGLWYAQYRMAEAEAAHQAVIRGGLQTLYEQGTDFMKERLPLINSVDLDKINKFAKDGDHFGGTAEKWVRENMGKTCADRLLELPSGFQQMHGSNKQVAGELDSLMILKRNLAELIDNDACGKV